jgi:uncharacterized protein
MTEIIPLYPQPVLLVTKDDKKYMAISDLHIGIESSYIGKGIRIDSTYAYKEMTEQIVDLIKKSHIYGIILLGDIKSTVAYINHYERKIIPEFLNAISCHTKVYLVQGNHDAGLDKILPNNINLISSIGMTIDDTLLTHGHCLPPGSRSSIKRIIIGHVHPIFYKKDSVLNGESVWVYLKVRKASIFPQNKGILDIIIIPAFNNHSQVEERTTQPRQHSISPIINRILSNDNILSTIIVTLDGYIVGDNLMLQNIV